MVRFEFDDKSLQDSQYIPFEGKFIVRIEKQEIKRSPKGNDVLHLEVLGMKEFSGKKGKEFITINQDHMWKLAGLFKAVGFSQEDLKANGGDPALLVGKYALLVRSDSRKEMGTNGKEVTRYNAKFFPLNAEELEGLPIVEGSEPSVPDFGAADSSDIPF